MNLGEVILASMKHVETILLFVFEYTSSTTGPRSFDKETTTQILYRLDQARDAAKQGFTSLFQGTNDDAPKTDKIWLEAEATDQSLFLVSLIEV